MAKGRVEAAVVRLHGQLVGHLWSSQGTTRFELAPEYRELPRRPVLGQVFEERPRHRWKQAQRLPQWFSNLLPEHKLRKIVAEGHEINPRNEFRLLTALGSDLPGAVEVVPDPDPSDGIESPEGEEISTTTGAFINEIQDKGTDQMDRYLIRFSLAGVQLKLSMIWSGQTLTLPGGGELGDHLVKLPSREFEHVPENEFSMMTWAREIGIRVPECDIRPVADLGPLPRGFGTPEESAVYVVRRFDRDSHGSGQDQRIHMEDLNQVLDNWPDEQAKYKGASFERLGRIILALCGEEDFFEYVRRLTFCIGIGNEDAHLKNWTIWYPDRIQPRLSPAYDLVSTVQYEELDRKMALKLGRTRDASRVDLPVMERLSSGTDIDPARVIQTVRQTLEAMRDSWLRIESDLPISSSFSDRLRDYQRSIPLVRSFAS